MIFFLLFQLMVIFRSCSICSTQTVTIEHIKFYGNSNTVCLKIGLEYNRHGEWTVFSQNFTVAYRQLDPCEGISDIQYVSMENTACVVSKGFVCGVVNIALTGSLFKPLYATGNVTTIRNGDITKQETLQSLYISLLNFGSKKRRESYLAMSDVCMLYKDTCLSCVTTCPAVFFNNGIYCNGRQEDFTRKHTWLTFKSIKNMPFKLGIDRLYMLQGRQELCLEMSIKESALGRETWQHVWESIEVFVPSEMEIEIEGQGLTTKISSYERAPCNGNGSVVFHAKESMEDRFLCIGQLETLGDVQRLGTAALLGTVKAYWKIVAVSSGKRLSYVMAFPQNYMDISVSVISPTYPEIIEENKKDCPGHYFRCDQTILEKNTFMCVAGDERRVDVPHLTTTVGPTNRQEKNCNKKHFDIKLKRIKYYSDTNLVCLQLEINEKWEWLVESHYLSIILIEANTDQSKLKEEIVPLSDSGICTENGEYMCGSWPNEGNRPARLKPSHFTGQLNLKSKDTGVKRVEKGNRIIIQDASIISPRRTKIGLKDPCQMFKETCLTCSVRCSQLFLNTGSIICDNQERKFAGSSQKIFFSVPEMAPFNVNVTAVHLVPWKEMICLELGITSPLYGSRWSTFWHSVDLQTENGAQISMNGHQGGMNIYNAKISPCMQTPVASFIGNETIDPRYFCFSHPIQMDSLTSAKVFVEWQYTASMSRRKPLLFRIDLAQRYKSLPVYYINQVVPDACELQACEHCHLKCDEIIEQKASYMCGPILQYFSNTSLSEDQHSISPSIISVNQTEEDAISGENEKETFHSGTALAKDQDNSEPENATIENPLMQVSKEEMQRTKNSRLQENPFDIRLKRIRYYSDSDLVCVQLKIDQNQEWQIASHDLSIILIDSNTSHFTLTQEIVVLSGSGLCMEDEGYLCGSLSSEAINPATLKPSHFSGYLTLETVDEGDRRVERGNQIIIQDFSTIAPRRSKLGLNDPCKMFAETCLTCSVKCSHLFLNTGSIICDNQERRFADSFQKIIFSTPDKAPFNVNVTELHVVTWKGMVCMELGLTSPLYGNSWPTFWHSIDLRTESGAQMTMKGHQGEIDIDNAKTSACMRTRMATFTGNEKINPRYFCFSHPIQVDTLTTANVFVQWQYIASTSRRTPVLFQIDLAQRYESLPVSYITQVVPDACELQACDHCYLECDQIIEQKTSYMCGPYDERYLDISDKSSSPTLISGNQTEEDYIPGENESLSSIQDSSDIQNTTLEDPSMHASTEGMHDILHPSPRTFLPAMDSTAKTSWVTSEYTQELEEMLGEDEKGSMHHSLPTSVEREITIQSSQQQTTYIPEMTTMSPWHMTEESPEQNTLYPTVMMDRETEQQLEGMVPENSTSLPDHNKSSTLSQNTEPGSEISHRLKDVTDSKQKMKSHATESSTTTLPDYTKSSSISQDTQTFSPFSQLPLKNSTDKQISTVSKGTTSTQPVQTTHAILPHQLKDVTESKQNMKSLATENATTTLPDYNKSSSIPRDTETFSPFSQLPLKTSTDKQISTVSKVTPSTQPVQTTQTLFKDVTDSKHEVKSLATENTTITLSHPSESSSISQDTETFSPFSQLPLETSTDNKISTVSKVTPSTQQVWTTWTLSIKPHQVSTSVPLDDKNNEVLEPVNWLTSHGWNINNSNKQLPSFYLILFLVAATRDAWCKI